MSNDRPAPLNQPQEVNRPDITREEQGARKAKTNEPDDRAKFDRLLVNDDAAGEVKKKGPKKSIFELHDRKGEKQGGAGNVRTSRSLADGDFLAENHKAMGSVRADAKATIKAAPESEVVNPGAKVKGKGDDIEAGALTAGKSDGGEGKGDPAAVSPIGVVAETANLRQGGPVEASSEIRVLADNIKDQFIQIKTPESTETVITVKHPAVFDGATVRLTEMKNAKGEFNVTFGNLNADAKALLDVGAHQDALRLAMDMRGIPLHVITTKTDADNLRADASNASESGDRDDEEKEERKERQR